MVKNLLLLISILLLPGVTLPQHHFFSTYSLEEGLSQSVVNCLYQDSQGFIWAGTQNGLNKFNGYAFEIYSYNPSDTNSLSNNWVYSIAEDLDGNLWVCTKNGLNKFVRKENRFHRIRYSTGYLHDVTAYPYDAIVSSSGEVLINTPPVLTVYDPAKKTFLHFTSDLEYDGSVKDNRIPLLEDTGGLIWVGSTRGLSCFDPKSKTFRYFLADPGRKDAISDNSITALFEDRKGTIWAGTNNGLNRYDKKTGRFISYSSDPRNPFSLSHNFIRSILQDNAGNFWIGTEGGGLNKLTFAMDDQPFFEGFTSENNHLSHNIVNSLIIDRSENLWIGTLQGISKTDLKKPKFTLYRRSDSPYSVNLLGNVIASIYKDENGILWIGNWGQGLNLFDRRTGHVEHFSTRLQGNHHLTNDFVHVVFGDSDHRTWIGTRDGAFIFDREKHRFLRINEYFRNDRIPSLRGVRIFMIIQDRAGSYWIGTQNGLYRINARNGTTEHFNEEAAEGRRISSNLIYSLLEDRDGIIWIATLNGLDAYDPGRGKLSHFRKAEGSENSLCDNFVISLCEDHAGRIWIGTSTYVNCFTKKDSLFTYYSQENGLPNNRIFEIQEDRLHNVWFATGNGLSRFDTVSHTFRTYTVEQGLQGLEFNLRASYKSPDGEMFFGGMNGVNSFYPDSIRDNPFVPPIVFTSFYTITGGIKKFLEIQNTEDVVLKYNENIFTIEFAALEYTNPRNNRYAYRLEGVSDAWIDLGSRRFVPFTNLPAGEYRFTVRGCNNDGKWNEAGKSLRIVIRPPWWRSWPAYISYFLVLVLLVVLYIKWRERNLIRQRNTLEKKVEQRTFQIERQKEELEHLNATKDKFFSIIAHDLRSPFNSILGFSDLLLSDFRKYDHEKIEKYLTNIKEASRQAFELLQNLLFWARSQTGTLEFKPVSFDLRDRIEENIFLVKSQAEKKSIRITHTATEGQTALGDVNMIDTVLRNLLTNAIKFSPRESSVSVQVRESGNQWEVTVKDSGIGIAAENLARIFRVDSKFTRSGTEKERGTGLGLILCKEFVERHGSTIHVESEPGRGSEFTFFLSKDNPVM
jgi:ligand-binding sensor domain-containing protein/signal transduction histidine kinase